MTCQLQTLKTNKKRKSNHKAIHKQEEEADTEELLVVEDRTQEIHAEEAQEEAIEVLHVEEGSIHAEEVLELQSRASSEFHRIHILIFFDILLYIYTG